MRGLEFSPDVADWINNDLAERQYRKLAGRLAEFTHQIEEGIGFDDEDPLAISFGDELFGLFFCDGYRDWIITYYWAQDGRAMFLTKFEKEMNQADEVRRAKQAVRRAKADGDSLDNV